MTPFSYKGVAVGYSDSGKGPVVVLLHGFLENRTMWSPLTQQIQTRYRVLAIDLLGHGDTASMGYLHSMEDNADLVYALLTKLRIRKAVLIGHSMGGYVALAFAELYPNHLKGIALVNSTAKADSDLRKKNRDRAIKAVKQNHKSFVRMSIANLFSEDNRDKLSREIEAVREEALKTPLQGIVASLEGMKIRKDREVLLHFLPCPILLVLSKKDPVLDFEETLEHARGTKTQTVIFEDGHMSHIENRDELIKSIETFIKRT
jgi:pimeloyl-ACP methyl ester carboxylesterase